MFDYLLYALALLFVVHLIECLLYWKLISKSPKGKLHGLVMTMLLGVVYIKRLKKL
jgi:hypothetical protein